MNKANTICRNLLLSQGFYFKQLLLLLLICSNVAAFAGLPEKQGDIPYKFSVLKSWFSNKTESITTTPAFTDSIVQLKADDITKSEATLSWARSLSAKKYSVTLYSGGLKVKSIITTSNTTTFDGLDASTTYTWNVTSSLNNIKSATASFTTLAAEAGEDFLSIPQVRVIDPGNGGGVGGGGGDDCTKQQWVKDQDGDGVIFGDVAIEQCYSPGEYYVLYTGQLENDCDDTDPAVNEPVTWVLDADDDGFYIGEPITACSSPGVGYVVVTDQVQGDCNDGNSKINPATIWYKDYDNDGFSDGVLYTGCSRPFIKINDDGNTVQGKLITELLGGPNLKYDCDDNNPNIYPGIGAGCIVNCPSEGIIYVKWDATGNNDGSSWANAFINLQDALLQACPDITQIWVAKGTYYPDQGVGKTNNDRNAAFVMKNGLAIYGGFAGTETSLNQRDWKTNITILSGDIDQNDGPGFTNNGGNSYHVVFNNGFASRIDFLDPVTQVVTPIINNTFLLNSSAILDGFTVKAGNANGLVELTMYGGGMFNKSSSPAVRNITFVENSTANNGGAVANQDKAEPTFKNCIFLLNNADESGGGMYNYASDVDLTNCSFIQNTANAGAGISNETTSTLEIVNSIFSRNTAEAGGAIFNNNFGDYPGRILTSTNCINCSFSLNIPVDITNNGAELIAANSIIVSGDGINSEPVAGQAVLGPGIINVTYSIIKPGFTGTGNIFTNPLYIDATNDNLRLQPGSSAIGAGNNAANNEQFDLDGFVRKVGTIDLGAYEAGAISCPQNIIYVSKTATGLNNGSSWDNAYTNLQDALSNQCPGITQIWVAKGTYYPDEGGGKTNNDRTASFAMKNGITIYGGFAGTETNLSERNWNVNKTILSGDIDQNDEDVIAVADLLANGSRSNNSYHVVQNNFSSGTNLTTAILDGFTITGGHANGTSYPLTTGGGLLNQYASPTIINCMFLQNAATSGGGGMYNNNAAPEIINSVFSGNYSGNTGGGIGNFDLLSIPVITNCTFQGNKAYTGGGISNAFATPVLVNCILWGNDGVLPSISDQSAAGTVSYSIVESRAGDYPGTGNLNVDPMFVNVANGDLQVKAISPAINTGNDAANSELYDIAGNQRKVGVIDMGAYEYVNLNQCSPVSVTNTTLAALQIEGCGTASVAPTSFAYSTTTVVLTQQQYESLNLPVNEGSCPIAGVSYKDVVNENLGTAGKWVIDRTFTITDDNGATAIVTQQITIEDKIAPTVNTKNITVQLEPGGKVIVTPAQVDNGSTDACDIASYSLSQTDFYCNHVGANTVTLTVTDVNGNVASATAVVTVEDLALPTVITKNITIQLDENGNASIGDRDVDAGSFDACGLVLYQTDKTVFNCSNVGANTVTLTVTDANGNFASKTATVTVLVFNNIYYRDNDGDGFGDPQSATSVCSGPAPSGYVANNTDCDDTRSDLNPNTVWYEDRDGDGYPSSRTATGCERPQFFYGGFIPTGFTLGKLASELQGLTVDCEDTDAFIVPGTTWYKDADNDGFSDGTTQTGCFRPTGYKRISEITATSGDCNDSYPTINPGAIEVCDGIDNNCNGFIDEGFIDTDNDDIANCIDTDDDNDGIPDAADCAPLDATNTPMVLHCPEDININNCNINSIETVTLLAYNSIGRLITEQELIAANCSIIPGVCAVATIAYKDAEDAASTSIKKVIRRTFNVTDINGRLSTCTQTIILEDKTAPTIVTKNITVELNSAGTATISDDAVNNGSSDNCTAAANLQFSTNIKLFTCANVGIPVTVNMTVTDANGNTDSKTAIVTVVDEIVPTVITKNIIINLNATGTAAITSAQINNGSIDNCGISKYELSKSNFKCSDVGDNTVTLTVTDEHGNSASKTAIVKVIDNIKPVITNITANPSSLWPPDRKMKPVTINTVNNDVCGTATCKIIAVRSNEPGDNDLTPDWLITGNNTVDLRAEQGPVYSQRIYTITIECKDASGNATFGETTVIVDKPAQGGGKGGGKGNSSIGGGGKPTKRPSEIVSETFFEVITAPNPSNSYFTLTVKSSNSKDRVQVRIMDELGRVLEQKDNVVSGSTIRFGDKYIRGMYFILVIQDDNRKMIKLIKQ